MTRGPSKKQKPSPRGRWNPALLGSASARPHVYLGVSFAQQASVCILGLASQPPKQQQLQQRHVLQGQEQGQEQEQDQEQGRQQLTTPDRQARALASIFARQARRLSHRSVVRLEKSQAVTSCRRCHSPLVPGLSTRLRVHSASQRRRGSSKPDVSLTCLSCQNIQRVALYPRSPRGKKLQVLPDAMVAPCEVEVLNSALRRLNQPPGPGDREAKRGNRPAPQPS